MMLNKGANANIVSQEGTPLHIACRHKFPEIVRLLVEMGANLEEVIEVFLSSSSSSSLLLFFFLILFF